MGVLVAAFAAAVPAAAQESGFEGGLRTGYGVPLGDAVDGADEEISGMIGGVVPLWFDVGYRVTPNVFIGAYFQYGFGVVGNDLEDVCDTDVVELDCSVNSHRVGAQLHYHFSPRESSSDPWLGIGLGYEWLSMSVQGEGGRLGVTSHGFEFANLQGGVDFYPADNFYLGPFLSFSFDQYGSVETKCSGPFSCDDEEGPDGDIEDKSIHNWLMFGIRGGFTGFGR